MLNKYGVGVNWSGTGFRAVWLIVDVAVMNPAVSFIERHFLAELFLLLLWWFETGVSGLPVGPIFKAQAVQEQLYP
jgi:hypothetical protein